MRRILFLICLACLSLSACSSGTQNPQANILTRETFKINVDTWLGYAPLYLAKEKGFFGNVDVQMILTPDVAQRKIILERGENQAIAETVDMLVLDHDEGIHSVAVTGLDFSNGADGIVAVDSIKSIADLKGKTILVQKNYASEALLNYLLEKNGIGFKEVRTVDTEAGAAGAAFMAGKTDVAVTFQPWLSKASSREGAHLLISSKDAPGVIVDILSINEKYLKAHPEVVATVVRGWFTAVEYWKLHPEEANAIMAKTYSITPQEFADQITGIIWPSYEENVRYFSKDGEPNIFSVADTFVSIFLKTGQISAPPDLASAIDASVLQQLYAQ